MVELCYNTFNHSAFLGIDPRLPAQIDAAAAAGFPWFGPDLYSLDAWVASGRRLEELVSRMNERQIKCWELAASVYVGDLKSSLTSARHAAEVSRILEPRWIQLNVSTPVDATTLQTFAQVCDILNDTGAKVAIEYVPISPVNSIATAQALVDHVGRDRAGILVDSWHHFRGPDTYADLEALPLDAIAYVQFDDALPMISADLVDEMLYRRTYPGEGEFDLPGFCARLLAKGFDSVASVEIISRALRDVDLPTFARRAFESSALFWPEPAGRFTQISSRPLPADHPALVAAEIPEEIAPERDRPDADRLER